MPGMLVAYDAAGNVIGTLDSHVVRNATGAVVGLADFAGREAAGLDNSPAVWTVPGAKGSKVWPEYLGAAAVRFTVELAGPPGAKSIDALIDKQSGYRRTRADVEQAIANAPLIDGAKDLRAIVGGPMQPLTLDATGATAAPIGTPT